MRPHTRTHCSRKGDCEGESLCSLRNHHNHGASSSPPTIPHHHQPGASTSGGAVGCNSGGPIGAGSSHNHAAASAHYLVTSSGGSHHMVGAVVVRRQGGGASYHHQQQHQHHLAGDTGADSFCSSSMSTASGKDQTPHVPSLVELPAELLVTILKYMSFKEAANVRLVSRRLNELCAARLNSTFTQLQNRMLVRFQAIKAQMPRRESARRNHPLARECDIVETLHMRLTLLQMTFGKHIERKHICFFPGEILDEVYRILNYIQSTHLPLGRAYKVTDELFDLSAMAMEYFKENIEPSLPDITYFGTDFLDFTPPFATPSKKLSTPGGGFESPISSRASAVGSSCSEPPISTNYNFEDDEEGGEAPSTNMVLRKRIKRIRAGMKKYNTQLDQVKRELKSCKSKMDSQSKQVAEYSSRLDEYDKKFEENSRKFGTLLTELNKCKTELQFYRSRTHLGQCQNCGSSLTDQASDSAQVDQVNIPDIEDVDKQAMVEDWLNPDNNSAPQVQYKLDDNQAIQKFSKTDEDEYLRGGPGSPGSLTRSAAAAIAHNKHIPSGVFCGQSEPWNRAGGSGLAGQKRRLTGASTTELMGSGECSSAGSSNIRKGCLRGAAGAHCVAKGTRPKRPKIGGKQV